MTGFLFIQRFYDLLITLLRSDRKFVILSRLLIVNAFGGLLATFIFVSKWNIYGLFAGTVLVTVGCFFFIQKTHPYHFHYYWNWKELLKQLKLGIPLLTATFLTQFFKSMDKLIIAKQLGFYEVGLYSLAMMVSSYILSFPMKFSNVAYPSMLQDYGCSDSAKAIKGYLMKPALVFAFFIPFVSGVMVFLMPALAHLFLKEFTAGLPVIKIYLIGIYFFILAQFSYNFLLTVDRYLITIPITMVSIAINFILNTLFLKNGWGLIGVAWGTNLSFIFFGITSFCAAVRHFEDLGEMIFQILKLLSFPLIFFGGIFFLDQAVHTSNVYGTGFLKLFIFLGFSAPFFWIMEKKVGLLKLLKEMASKKKNRPKAAPVAEGGGEAL
jgi:O-antigen/teichoic acid export membrane protein